MIRTKSKQPHSGEDMLNILATSILPDRNVEELKHFSIAPYGTGMELLQPSSVISNGSIEIVEKHVETYFHGGEDSYQFRFKLDEKFLATGVGAHFRLRNWGSLKYVAIGYTLDGVFRHVKIPNSAREKWVEFSIGHKDLGFGLHNNWDQPPAAEIDDIRVYIKGTPSEEGACLDIESLWCWNEPDAPALWKTQYDSTSRIQTNLLDVSYNYLKKCFRKADTQAEKFMSEGTCQLYGEISLNWTLSEPLPSDLSDVGTYGFSWHSLHPATILMIHYRNTGEISALFAAREFITNWLDRSYYQADLDKKYAWYDHGTAERQLTMVLMWSIGLEHGFDYRFMTRLRMAIFHHGQLLNSELFYASHQPTRYHNHAWFQDLALMATALAMQDFPCAENWLETSLTRLSDQLEQLIVRDSGFAVFVENSIGYHQGVQRLVEFAGDLVTLTGKGSVIPVVAKELSSFSEFLRYPDNRAPAQGDTFRLRNASGEFIRRLKPYPNPECQVLSKAGYTIVKGNHENVRFMLTMLATSLCRTHKHEDNLSFTLFFDGIEWLIDPSFYSHEYAAPIPAYLRSATAHNALSIPNLPYSIEPDIAYLDGDVKGNKFTISGHHNSYKNITIKRKLKGKINSLDLKVTDASTGNTDDDLLLLMFHCGEQVQATLNGCSLKLTHPESKYALQLTIPNTRCRIHHGQVEGDQIRGVTGLGFMEVADIDTIECEVPPNTKLKWSLKASKV